MGNSRTFLGAFLLVIAILIQAVAIFALHVIVPSITGPVPLSFELLLIFIAGALGGIGMGGVILKSGKGEKADQLDLIIAGIGAASVFALAVWFWIVDSPLYDEAILYSVIASIIALFSLTLVFATWDS